MTRTDDDDRDGPSPVDSDYVSNLDALTRDLGDVEALAATALVDEPIDRKTAECITDTPAGLTYDELTAYNLERRAVGGWGEAEMADILDPVAFRQLDEWRDAQRLPWERGDPVVVGVAGLIGALANLYDTQIDAAVLDGLRWLKKSEFLQQWEKDAARLSIDYTGPNFGGPAHRARSAGHDIGRFFNALNQVRTGTFEGVWWDYGERIVDTVATTRSGLPFAQAADPYTALTLLLKHWAADFVTPMSLPLPGWSLFNEMSNRDLRKFAQAAYAGTNSGDGLNLRSGAFTPGLGVVATEVIIRTHTHLAAYVKTGSPLLTTSATSKRTEMLLAAHAAAGAVSLSKTAAAAIAGEGAVAVRHLNVPVLLRVGMLALTVRSDAATRASGGAPSWERLLKEDAATWTLPEAAVIAELLEGGGQASTPA